MEMSPKNLFLLDINQLWSQQDFDHHQEQETLHVQVQTGSNIEIGGKFKSGRAAKCVETVRCRFSSES